MQTIAPAITPITVADVGDTNAHGAVMATNPSSMPLQAIVMSGLPNMKYQSSIAVAEPAMAERLVLTAITEMRRSVAPRVWVEAHPYAAKFSIIKCAAFFFRTKPHVGNAKPGWVNSTKYPVFSVQPKFVATRM